MDLGDAEIGEADPGMVGIFKMMTGISMKGDERGDHAELPLWAGVIIIPIAFRQVIYILVASAIHGEPANELRFGASYRVSNLDVREISRAKPIGPKVSPHIMQ
tara:strand:- start:1626 stop:1937 length:312 start_codon:yes stop_codon:yes gene_type:complete